jgi:hypothetical protein
MITGVQLDDLLAPGRAESLVREPCREVGVLRSSGCAVSRTVSRVGVRPDVDGDLLAREPAQLTSAPVATREHRGAGSCWTGAAGADRRRLHQGVLGQAVWVDRGPAGAGRLPRLPAGRRHPRDAEPQNRLSRSPQDPIGLVAELRRRSAGFRSLHEALDITTPGCRPVFQVFAALAEFIRELIVERPGRARRCAARGQRLGRRPYPRAGQPRSAATGGTRQLGRYDRPAALREPINAPGPRAELAGPPRPGNSKRPGQ